MKTTKQMGMRPWLLFWAMLITGVIGAEGVQGQTFYGFYGDHQDYQERGFNRVIPVTRCLTSNLDGCQPVAPAVQVDGYIAVGYSTMPSQGAYSDVYVVRTFNDGTTAWEKTYDIGDNQMNDWGYAIVELAPNPDNACFAIVGTSEQVHAGGVINTDIFVLLIDLDGVVIRSSTFDAGGNEEGRDMVQTQYQYVPQPPPLAPYPGNPAPVASLPGDLVYCGWTDAGAGGTDDGVIIRSNLNLVRAWDVQYDLPVVNPPGFNSQDRFFALTEAFNLAPPAARNGDILVTGRHFSPVNPNGVQGVIGRVQGFDGLTTAAGTGFGDYGGTDEEEFNSIIELTGPNGMGGTPGDVVVAGRTNTPSGGTFFDVYMVSLPAGNPCAAVFVDVYFGDAGLDTANHVGMCVREIQVAGLAIPSAGVGNLMVTGYTDANAVNVADDIFWMPVAMPGLTPGPLGFVYGDFGTNQDQGISVADVPAVNGRTRGYIICGWTDGAYKSNHCNVLPNNSTDDLFLIKTNSSGESTLPCRKKWAMPFNRNLPSGCLTSTSIRPFVDTPEQTPDECWDTDVQCCESSDDGPEKRRNDAAPEADEDLSGSMIRTRPNPVKGGDVLNLTVAPPEPATIMVTVTNMRGEEIFRRELPEVREGTDVPISTDGWPSGAYLLKATDGKRIDAVRINVLE